MKNYLFISFVVIGILSCQKNDEENNHTKDLWDEISETEYYENEILQNAYLDFYGKWDIKKIAGGYSGLGYEENFDYLEVRNFGIYGFIRNDSLLEYGRIEIKEQSEDKLWIILHRDDNSSYFFPEYELFVELPEEDSLNIFSAAMDGYNYYFNRIK